MQVPRYKIPTSTLVVVYTPDLDVLLIERADFPEHWQSVTGSQEPGETLVQTATRELCEETGIDANAYGGVVDWGMQNDFEIFKQWSGRYPPGTRNRGARRIVCGGPPKSPDACYYSADHYNSFARIRE